MMPTCTSITWNQILPLRIQTQTPKLPDHKTRYIIRHPTSKVRPSRQAQVSRCRRVHKKHPDAIQGIRKQFNLSDRRVSLVDPLGRAGLVPTLNSQIALPPTQWKGGGGEGWWQLNFALWLRIALISPPFVTGAFMQSSGQTEAHCFHIRQSAKVATVPSMLINPAWLCRAANVRRCHFYGHDLFLHSCRCSGSGIDACPVVAPSFDVVGFPVVAYFFTVVSFPASASFFTDAACWASLSLFTLAASSISKLFFNAATSSWAGQHSRHHVPHIPSVS